MITVYEIKRNGYLGASKQVDPREGVNASWTYAAPTGDGPHRWVGGQWEPCEAEPEETIYAINKSAVAQSAREKRDALLSACDWTQTLDAPVDRKAWAEYRQVLRDLPQQPGFPFVVEFPTKPE
jgi:hypothetical protein